MFARVTQSPPGHAEPAFESWYGEAQVFHRDDKPVEGEALQLGIHGFSRASLAQSGGSAGAPVLSYTLYNVAAYRHIRGNKLERRSQLDMLRVSGNPDRRVLLNRSVPEFPEAAIVMKTVWWPVAPGQLTALPVWDPESNPARQRGNDFTSWQRVIAVDTRATDGNEAALSIDFVGRSIANPHRAGLDSFHHVAVDAPMAKRLMSDSESLKVAMIALGRPIKAGDWLVLVGANLATRELENWVWVALWWHDRPKEGPDAIGRPTSVEGVWRQFLMQVAFDADRPASADGGPHICFNPWLEGRFPNMGRGGGTVSNCLACHARASYPAVPFLPVTRGAAPFAGDVAYFPDRLRTSSLWSLALHAGP